MSGNGPPTALPDHGVQAAVVAGSRCKECADLRAQFEENPGGKKFSKTGIVLAAATGGAAVVLSAICLPFVAPALRKVCLPYVPATDVQVQNVLKVLSGSSGRGRVQQQLPRRTLVDLGSGDGRIVIAAAKAGGHRVAHGVELNPWLVWYSRISALRQGCGRGSATFARQDLWKSDLSGFDDVVVFGVEEMMPRLEAKLSSELRPGARVVACRFPLPGKAPHSTFGEGIDTVWLYLLADIPTSKAKDAD